MPDNRSDETQDGRASAVQNDGDDAASSKVHTPACLYFGSFRLDPERFVLYEGDRQIPLRRKSIALLHALIQRHGQVLSRRDLVRLVWCDVQVEETIIGPSLLEIRRALHDTAKASRFIETVHGRGVRFIAKMQAPPAPPQPSTLREHMPPVRAQVSTPASVAPAFIGRAQIMQRLAQALHEAQAGHHRIISIGGPVGVGKTRLLHEFSAIVHHLGAETLYGRGESAAQRSSFWIWSQMLSTFAESRNRRELQDILGDAAADIGRIVPAVQERLGLPPTPLSIDPRGARGLFFQGVGRFVKNLASRRPVVLVLDDLHQASDGSLALLESLLGGLDGSRVLVIAALRQETQPQRAAAQDFLASRVGAADRWTLAGLAHDEARRLIEMMAGGELAADLVEKIITDTHGNPYFILEILRSLRTQAATSPGAIRNYDVPPTVRRAVEQCFATLSKPALALLRAGAVLGALFDAADAACIAEVDDDDVRAGALAEAVASGLVSDVGAGSRFSFQHNLSIEVLREGMPRSQWADLHRRAAQVIEPSALSQDGAAERLAYHFAEAAPLIGATRALHYGAVAAENALDVYSNQEALDCLSRALRVAESDEGLDEAASRRVLEDFVEVKVRLGHFEEAEAVADRLRQMARRRSDVDGMAKSALALARCYLPYQPHIGDKPIDALEEALAARTSDASFVDGLLCARLAVALLMRPMADVQRIELGRRAVQIASGLADRREQCKLLFEVIPAFWDADHIDEQVETANRLFEIAMAAGDRHLGFAAGGWQALAWVARGKLRAAQARLRDIEAVLGDHLSDGSWRYLLRIEVVIAVAAGRLADAEAIVTKVGTLAPHAVQLSTLVETTLARFAIQRERSTLETAVPLLQGLAEQMPMFPLRVMMMVFLAEAGHGAEAAAEMRGLPPEFLDKVPRNEAFCWLSTASGLADVAADVGDLEWAERLFGYLLPYEGQWAVIHLGAALAGSVTRCLGRLAAVLGRPDAASLYFEKATEECVREGVVTELVRTKLFYGLALQQLGDLAAAESRLREAIALAQPYQLSALAARAEAVLESIANTPRRSA